MFYLFFMPCSVEICSMLNIHCHCHHKRSIVSVIYAAWFVSCLTSTNQTHFRSRSIYRIYRITSASWCNIPDLGCIITFIISYYSIFKKLIRLLFDDNILRYSAYRLFWCDSTAKWIRWCKWYKNYTLHSPWRHQDIPTNRLLRTRTPFE